MSQENLITARLSRSNKLIEKVHKNKKFMKWSDLISGGSKSALKWK